MVTQPDIPLKIALSGGSKEISTAQTSIALHITVTNTHPTSSVSFLRWSTPLDPLGAAMGLFVVKPLPHPPTDEEVEPLKTLGLKPKRLMPQSEIFPANSDQVITLEAGQSVERDVLLHEPQYVGLVKGEKYAVGVTGTWHGIWVNDGELMEFSVKEGSRLLRGSYDIEGVEIVAS